MTVFSIFSTVASVCSSLGAKARKTAKSGKKINPKLKNVFSLPSSSSSSSSSSVDKPANKRLVLKIHSNLSSKALLKMISWRKVHGEPDTDHYDDYYNDDEEALWRKAIMKGEKCRPLDFSGKIVYDVHGNLIPSL